MSDSKRILDVLDSDAIAALRERLYGYCSRRLRDPEDVVQEVFTRLLESNVQYSIEMGSPQQYAFGIARKMIPQILRSAYTKVGKATSFDSNQHAPLSDGLSFDDKVMRDIDELMQIDESLPEEDKVLSMEDRKLLNNALVNIRECLRYDSKEPEEENTEIQNAISIWKGASKKLVRLTLRSTGLDDATIVDGVEGLFEGTDPTMQPRARTRRAVRKSRVKLEVRAVYKLCQNLGIEWMLGYGVLKTADGDNDS